MTTMRERARAWLLHQPQEPDDLLSHTALLEAVERETVARERAERDVYRKALVFYADPLEWGKDGDAIADEGKVARRALTLAPAREGES